MNWKRSDKQALTSPPTVQYKPYLIQAPNKDWLVLHEGNPDYLLGTFRTKADATSFLNLKLAEVA